VEKTLREEILRMLPGKEQIRAGAPVNISIDVAAAVAAENQKLQQSLNAGDVSTIIARYPVRETPALGEIAVKLGFRNRDQYEGAVRQMAMDDENALSFMRTLFGDLAAEINC
jgi:hypothetical protein